MAARFRAQGWEVTGSARSPKSPEVARLELGDTPDTALFTGVDVVIHAAYDPKAGLERNHTGTARIREAAARAGVARQIFISSYSARANSPSVYGQMKYALEQEFLREDMTIVRPGLVTGGGMFAVLAKGMLRLPAIPLPGGGMDLVPILDRADFAEAMVRVVESSEEREFNLFAPRMIRSREVARTIIQTAGKRTLLVPIPIGLAIAGATAAAWLRVIPKSAVGGLHATRLNREAAYESDLERLIGRSTPAAEAVRTAVERMLR